MSMGDDDLRVGSSDGIDKFRNLGEAGIGIGRGIGIGSGDGREVTM